MKKTGWIITLLVSIALVLITVVGLKPKEVSLSPGCHITQAYHYYPDGTRCHCMVIAGFMDDKPYLDAHDFRIEDKTDTSCTLVFKIGNSNTLYCVDNYPLSQLRYNENDGSFGVRAVVVLGAAIVMIISIVKLAGIKRECIT